MESTLEDICRLYTLPLLIAVMVLAIRVMYMLPKKKLEEEVMEQRINDFAPHLLVDSEPDVTFREVPVVPFGEDCFNFAQVDFLSLSRNDKVLNSAVQCIKQYGVGTCGPRAFYGGTDTHLQLEKCLREFLKMEDCLVYAFGFTTISSSICCYCKPKDIVFVDEYANVAIRQGIAATKCEKVTFKHNNAKDLAAKVKTVCDKEMIFQSPKILIVEGVYNRDGTICPLPELIDICREHRIRLFIDETISFGSLGDHGKGVTEHFDVDIGDVDLIIGSLEQALVSYGGFCAGSRNIIEHQRLASKGYTYSASLPTYSVSTAMTVLKMIDDRPKYLRMVSVSVHNCLLDVAQFVVKSHPQSPVKVFAVKNDRHLFYVRRLYDFFKTNSVYVLEWEDGLKMNLYVNLGLELGYMDRFFEIIKSAVDICLEN